MKWLLIATIRLYRRFLRQRLQRVCIFRESCSTRVLAAARTRGLWAGLIELKFRMRQCRPGYRPLGVHSKDGERLFILADASVVSARFLSARVWDEFPITAEFVELP